MLVPIVNVCRLSRVRGGDGSVRVGVGVAARVAEHVWLWGAVRIRRERERVRVRVQTVDSTRLVKDDAAEQLGDVLAQGRQLILHAYALVVDLGQALGWRRDRGTDFKALVPGLDDAIEIIIDEGAIGRFSAAARLKLELP